MGIFRRNNRGASENEITTSQILPNIENPTQSGTYTNSDGEIRYIGNTSQVFGDISLRESPQSPTLRSDAGGDMIDWWDIAQSHFFTVQIYGRNSLGEATGLHDYDGQSISLASGEGVFRNYIPLKSMNFNYTSYDNMNIPFGIFGDFPLLNKKKVTSISFSCYDSDQDEVEKALHYWERQCFPGGNYVSYLDDVAATLTYTSYDVCGHKNFQRILQVIPANSVSVSRSYEENAAKILNFSVAAIGAVNSGGASGYKKDVYGSITSLQEMNEWPNRPMGRDEVNNGTNSKYDNVEGIGGGIIRGSVSRFDFL